jgi:hypothetical protein
MAVNREMNVGCQAVPVVGQRFPYRVATAMMRQIPKLNS